jgi:predicted amidophosphoribosyltransferase
MMLSILKYGFDSIQALFFPPLCLHCKETLPKELHILCASCLHLLELLSPQGRCPTCFYERTQRSCMLCANRKPSYDYAAAVYAEYGPAKSLLYAFREEKRYYLAKSIAPFFLLQHEQLQWELPDCIVTPPQTLSSHFLHGEAEEIYIAKELARLFGCPYKTVSKKSDVHDTIILMISTLHPEMDAASPILQAAEHMQRTTPKRLYVMSFCMPYVPVLAINKTLL